MLTLLIRNALISLYLFDQKWCFWAPAHSAQVPKIPLKNPVQNIVIPRTIQDLRIMYILLSIKSTFFKSDSLYTYPSH